MNDSGKRVQWHVGAPEKPPVGAPCNGCGLCCLSGPCPLGMLLSRRFSGACALLSWHAAQRRYVCGALARWQDDMGNPMSKPGDATRKARGWRRLMYKLARRWIAAGIGCDADLQYIRDGKADP
ncbi:MAG: hypothetical protein LBB55_04045 [Zoogloeaceae bacterium]|nr:hypothetical protein [Zoogloeaceae bacterium]